MRKALKIAGKIVFWTFFVCLFIVTSVTVILYVYEDDIKQFAIEELNENLNTDIEVMDIELSVFHDFPYASLQFNKVFISDAFESYESEDTLLYAEQMFLNFSLLDIWNGDYKVKRLNLLNGELNLKTNSDGEINYDVLKKENDSIPKKESNFNFLLNLLTISDFDFNYKNLATNQYYDIRIEHGLLQGDFTKDQYDLTSEADLYVNELKSGSFKIIQNKAAKIDIKLLVDRLNKKYSFEKGFLDIEEMPFDISGYVDSNYINMSVVGREIKIDQLANSLVDESLDNAKKYQGEGVVNFVTKIEGELAKTAMPSVVAEFSVKNGSLIEPENNLEIYDVQLTGKYQNKQEDREELLRFPHFKMKLLNSFFDGSGEVSNFSQPTISSNMKGDLDLDALQKFMKLDKIKTLKGHINLDLEFVIRFLDPEYRKDKFEIIASDGELNLKEIAYQKTAEDLLYHSINGNIIINGEDAAAKNLSIKTKESDILLNGALKNFIPFIEGTGNLGLIASLESSKIDLNEFLGESNKDKAGPPTMFEIPSDLNLNLELDINQLKWDNHTFDAISGKLLMANRKITARSVHLKTLGGDVRGHLILNNLMDKGNIIDGKFNFNGIDVKQLFAEWENFDQESITSEHISGFAEGKIDFLLFFNQYFSIIEDKIYSNADVEIKNGQLKDLETMKSITDYMRTNKGLKLLLNKHIDDFESKLMNLVFDNLHNKIQIKDRKVTIPKMTIQSNAMDVDLFGWHDFDNNIEYHFSFRFRELKTVAEYSEFGKIEDDGLGITIFLTMSGSLDDPVFSLDKDERKNAIKENIEEEKQNVKSILKTEFGLFKKDSTVQQIEIENKKEVEFIYYEEDIDLKSDTIIKEKNKGRVGKFFEKMKEDAEKNKDQIEYEPE